jgi:hypothetical protein
MRLHVMRDCAGLLKARGTLARSVGLGASMWLAASVGGAAARAGLRSRALPLASRIS